MLEGMNARGGVGGRLLELQTLDDGYEPERCADNTRKLIDAGAFALFGYIGTPTSLAALPLATQAKLPFVAPFTGAEALRTPFNRYAFHVRASYFDETAAIVKQVTSLGVKRIAVFHQNDSYGKAGLEGVTRRAAAARPAARRPRHGGAQHRRGGRGGEVDHGREPGGDRADRRLQGLRGLRARGTQGGLQRHLLQRVLRRHGGAGAGTGGPMRAAWRSAR